MIMTEIEITIPATSSRDPVEVENLTHTAVPAHDCFEEAVPILTNGPLGHGWACGICGTFLQAG